QTVHEGVSVRARVRVSSDRRYVRAQFIEKSRELQGTEKVNVAPDGKGKEVEGERVFLKEAEVSQVQFIPDGGSLLLPLHYRPRVARENGRWWVALVVVRVYIEEEERQLRGPLAK